MRDVVFPSEDDYEPFFHTLLDNIGKVDRKLAGQTAIHIKEEYSTLDWIMEDLLKKSGSFKQVFHDKEIKALHFMPAKRQYNPFSMSIHIENPEAFVSHQ